MAVRAGRLSSTSTFCQTWHATAVSSTRRKCVGYRRRDPTRHCRGSQTLWNGGTERSSWAAPSYQIVPLQLGKERAVKLREEFEIGGRCPSRYLDEACEIRGPACEPVEVHVVPFLPAPKIGQRCHRVMYQAFDWNSCKIPGCWGVLTGMLPELSSAGVNMVWLPSCSDLVDEHGYLLRTWYKLDSRYGTASELQCLPFAMDEQEIVPMLDVVVNHRCASEQDSAGRWLEFREPSWGGWAVCHDSPAVGGGTGNGVTGEPAQYAPSIDHRNPKVAEDIHAYLDHMVKELGFRGLRFDFVKAYSVSSQLDYLRGAGSPFAVTENWNGDAKSLHDYVRQCHGQMAVYVFPLYYVLKRSFQSNNFLFLVDSGRCAGILGLDAERAVTFAENHDTSQLAIVGGRFGRTTKVLRGYAFILTHPGVPCI